MLATHVRSPCTIGAPLQDVADSGKEITKTHRLARPSATTKRKRSKVKIKIRIKNSRTAQILILCSADGGCCREMNRIAARIYLRPDHWSICVSRSHG